jgi:spermidine/putrescine ABC transporter ATP-binding subunit
MKTRVLPPAIGIAGVAKRLGETLAVAGLSLDIAPGEFMTVLGPSGSGKTTLLHLIAGFHQPDSGAIWMHGQDVSRTPPYRRDIGLIFQNYALFPHMTVYQNVAYPLANRGVRLAEIDARVRACLARVKMAEFAERHPSQLSGGQQQRVALARSIVYDPKVVLMDEPLGALDKHLRRHMQDQIKEIHRETGATIVYVTHDQEEAMSMSDRIAIMRDGRIVQCDAPEILYRNPASRFVAEFLGEANLIDIAIGPDGSAHAPGGAAVPAAIVRGREPGRVSALFRPEQVSIAPGEGAGPLASGIVRTRDFLGDKYRVILDVDGLDAPVVVKQEAGETIGALPPGATARVTWHWKSCVLLDD